MDFAIVNTALPSIQRDLTLTFVQLQWVMNIFVLALCIFMVNMGRFGDIFGRRVLLYTGLACFAAASLLAGLAPNGPTLIAARAFQGFAITMIVPSSLALVSHTVAPSERGRAIGIWTSVTGVGLAIGPVAGGLLTSVLSWRWIFFVNIPIVAIAFALCSMSIKDAVRSDTEQRVDWAGFLLMIRRHRFVGLRHRPRPGMGVDITACNRPGSRRHRFSRRALCCRVERQVTDTGFGLIC